MTFKTGNYKLGGAGSGVPIELTQVLPDGYEWRKAVTGQLQLWRVDVTPEALLTEQDVALLDVNGSIRAAVNTLFLEKAHAIKSSGEEIAFKNLETGVNFMPAWAGSTPGGNNVTPLGGILEDSLNDNFEPGGTLLTTGAVNAEFTSIISSNATFYAASYVCAEVYSGELSLVVKDSRNEVVFKYDIPEDDYSIGAVVTAPDIFYRVRVGNTRTIGIYKADGTPMLVRPGSTDNTKPYRKYSVRTFQDRRVVLVGADGKINLSDLPDLNTSEVLVLATETQRLALPTVDKLYVVTQTEAGPNSGAGFQWLLNPNTDPSVVGNWVRGANLGTNVTTFNGRSGPVEPQLGDYTASQVGAVSLPGEDGVRRVLIGNIPTQEIIYDGLDSTSSTSVLAANQGRILNESKQATITGAASSVVSSNLAASKVLISDTNGKIAADASVDTTELSYLNGVSSNIQTQLNDKQATVTGAATSVVSNNLSASRVLVSDANGKIASSSSVTALELSYIDGVTSNVQTQLNDKQATVTGAATSVVSSNLSASKVLVSDANGKIAADASVDTTELSYLNGVSSNIQTQLDGKKSKTHTAIGFDLVVSAQPKAVFLDKFLTSGLSTATISAANVPWVYTNIDQAERSLPYWIQELTTFFKNLENDTQFDQLIGAIPANFSIPQGAWGVAPNAGTDMDNQIGSTATYASESFELVVGKNAAGTEIYTFGFTLSQFANATYDTTALNPFRIIFQTSRGSSAGFNGVAIGAISGSVPRCSARSSSFTVSSYLASAFPLMFEPITLEINK